jgi:hypothetical protein
MKMSKKGRVLLRADVPVASSLATLVSWFSFSWQQFTSPSFSLSKWRGSGAHQLRKQFNYHNNFSSTIITFQRFSFLSTS